jgi:adenylate cyclase
MLTDALAGSLRQPLATLMEHLGRARDLDVLLTEIANPVLTALPDEPRLPALASDITNRRYAARAQALAVLASPDYGKTLLAVLEALHPADANADEAVSLRDFAAQRLGRLQRKLRRLAAAADPEQPAALHALRIAVKRLRYALEFFAPLAPPKAFDRALRRLSGAQDTLGQLNDLTNAGTLLMECAGDDPRLREAVTLIGGWHGPRYASLQAGLARQQRSLVRLRLPKLAAEPKS